MSKELLFSITAKDCEWSYTKGSGKGGQARNKISSAVHCFHRPSGAHGYSEATRSQRQNREDAFRKMANSKEFQNWNRLQAMKKIGQLQEIEDWVEGELNSPNTKIEYKDETGKWIKGI